MRNIQWWLWSAAVIAVLMVMLGVGNLIDDDGGPLYGQIVFLAVLGGGAALIAAGVVLRSTNPRRSGRLIALGVLPGSVGIAFFWFPPAVLVGILALVTSWAAFQSGSQLSREAAAR